MAKRIQQFRYYGPKQPKNQPMNITYQNLSSGSIFSNYIPILQLGVQALPGTKFYLNNSREPVIIGNTGIYELDLNGQVDITGLSFDRASVNAVNNNENGYIIVDIIYDDGEE